MLQLLERKISLLFCLFFVVVVYIFIYYILLSAFLVFFFFFFFFLLSAFFSIRNLLSAFLHSHPPSAGIWSASYRHPKTRPLWSLFCELGTSSQDQFCLEIEVYLWRKREKQLFSKTVIASKLTCQRTLEINKTNNAHLCRSRC